MAATRVVPPSLHTKLIRVSVEENVCVIEQENICVPLSKRMYVCY